MKELLLRRAEVLRIAADQALRMPLRESGFWLHEDLRDNAYFAMHGMIYEYETNPDQYTEREPFQRYCGVLSKAIRLQDANPDSPMYGHWPLRLPDDIREAKPHELPVELMGCLFILFHQKYRQLLPIQIQEELQAAIGHIYNSQLYAQRVTNGSHHEAKHTALKLLLGYTYKDSALLAKGQADLAKLLEQVRGYGMREYGSLPWFWHWVQSLTCAWEVLDDSEVLKSLEEMLDFLWQERSLYYIAGAWAGPHSRVLAHDVPGDANVWLDYIQFGEFPIPTFISRLEGAGLFHYQISETIKEAAKISRPVELKKTVILPAAVTGTVDVVQHIYLFRTPDYAVGGMWERAEEYLNEQHRWDITLPRREGGNQAFFYHPGKGYVEGDARHASEHGDVIFGKNCVAAVFRIPESGGSALSGKEGIVGWLPNGKWIFEESSGYGCIDGVYLMVHSLNPFTVEVTSAGLSVKCTGNRHAVAMEVLTTAAEEHAVVMEVLASDEAAGFGIDDLASFVEKGKMHKLRFASAQDLGKAVVDDRDVGSAKGAFRLTYHSISGVSLKMEVIHAEERNGEQIKHTVDGKVIDFADYKV